MASDFTRGVAEAFGRSADLSITDAVSLAAPAMATHRHRTNDPNEIVGLRAAILKAQPGECRALIASNPSLSVELAALGLRWE